MGDVERPRYLPKYFFDWELFEVFMEGKAALDSKFFVYPALNHIQVQNFLAGYGLDLSDPVNKAEIFGTYQESMQFIRHHFLQEGDPEGLPLSIPAYFYTLTDVAQLFELATGTLKPRDPLDRLWAEVILKIMHTIMHVDKNLWHNYYAVIQRQILEKFQKYIFRDENGNTFLGIRGEESIPLVDFQVKTQKPRDSIILKLLTKAENVAEELFDIVGMRFITRQPFDGLRVVQFLAKHNLVILHNLKPSRSFNTLIELKKFQEKARQIWAQACAEQWPEDRFLPAMEAASLECVSPGGQVAARNLERSRWYRSIQFTGRELITYRDPFLAEFNKLRHMAKNLGADNELAQKVLALDTSMAASAVRFFYPYEIQITDEERHRINTEGEASYRVYKQEKKKAAIRRVFWAIMQHLNLTLP